MESIRAAGEIDETSDVSALLISLVTWHPEPGARYTQHTGWSDINHVRLHRTQ